MERISEENWNGVFLQPANQDELLTDINFDFLTQELKSCADIEFQEILRTMSDCTDPCTEPAEIDTNITVDGSQEFNFEHHNDRALISPEPIIECKKQAISHKKSVPLSQSVGVGMLQNEIEPCHSITLVYQLEETFRARYKSDYFSQGGRKRRPRYVADRSNNHFVTIKVSHGLRGQIRVDWLTTPDKNGHRFSMPYRFQKSNDSSDIADCNPIYFNIDSDANGIVKLYIVLIKAKQDELKHLQPLQPFRPLKNTFGVPDDTYTKKPTTYLTPKKLIQIYQLNTSQLAFTYCATGTDGTPIPEWNTTVYSTVMTELPPETSKQKHVTCPRCTHVFQPPTIDKNEDEDIDPPQNFTTKRKADLCFNYVQNPSVKRHNIDQNDFFSFIE